MQCTNIKNAFQAQSGGPGLRMSKIWNKLAMTEKDFRLMMIPEEVGDLDILLPKILDPMSEIWKSHRESRIQLDAASLFDTDAAREHAGLTVTLVKWALGGDDPDIWIDDLKKNGSTNTCNYVSCRAPLR